MPKFEVTVEVKMRRTMEAESHEAARDAAWLLAEEFLDESIMWTWDTEVYDSRAYEVTR